MPPGRAPWDGSGHPRLPQIVEQSVRAAREDEYGGGGVGEPPPQTPTSTQECSSRSDLDDMAIQEKEKEKARLQRLLKDFAKESVAGIPVNMVNTRTGRMPPYLFQMDRRLAFFSLRPADGSA